jgi:hypothetical protein
VGIPLGGVMKKINLVITTLILSSCASMYRHPESIAEKMHRYKSREQNINKVPEYEISKVKITKNRMPASTRNEEVNLSNKKLYFTSLYEQYDSFSQMYPKFKKNINVCPVFHQEVISYKETPKKWSWSQKKVTNVTNGILASLPGETLEDKVAMHMNSTYQELDKLCQIGTSNNYYIYENLITLVNNDGVIKKDKESVNTLLKTSIFFNRALMTKVGKKSKMRARGRTIASKVKKVSYDDAAINRMNASWATNLFE